MKALEVKQWVNAWNTAASSTFTVMDRHGNEQRELFQIYIKVLHIINSFLLCWSWMCFLWGRMYFSLIWSASAYATCFLYNFKGNQWRGQIVVKCWMMEIIFYGRWFHLKNLDNHFYIHLDALVQGLYLQQLYNWKIQVKTLCQNKNNTTIQKTLQAWLKILFRPFICVLLCLLFHIHSFTLDHTFVSFRLVESWREYTAANDEWVNLCFSIFMEG